MPHHWSMGEDVFVPADPNIRNNFGYGKRHPRLQLFRDDGTEVPVHFAYSENASMTGPILKRVFEKMDKKGISKRTFDENGQPLLYPLIVVDGHSSRMDGGFLRYVNQSKTKWLPVLGVPYGTSIWQVHDDKRQNGAFKMALSHAKSQYIRKKRAHNLKPEIVPLDIVIVARDAIENSFLRRDLTLRALSHRGWYPYNRNTLMDPEILPTAPDDVRQTTINLLKSRGIDDADVRVLPATDANLLESGSGQLAGGDIATEELAQTMLDLNHNCPTAADIVNAFGKAKKLHEGRINNMQRTIPSGPALTQVYLDAPRLTFYLD